MATQVWSPSMGLMTSEQARERAATHRSGSIGRVKHYLAEAVHAMAYCGGESLLVGLREMSEKASWSGTLSELLAIAEDTGFSEKGYQLKQRRGMFGRPGNDYLEIIWHIEKE